MLTHVGAYVSSLEENTDKQLIEKVEEIQTSIVVIGEQLRKHSLILANHNDNEAVVEDIPYPTLEMQIRVTSFVIQTPTPFPYESAKAVPWRYKPKVFKQWHEN